MPDEDKVLHLVKLLSKDSPASEGGKMLTIEVRAAKCLADEHVAQPLMASSKAQKHAPAVLLAALALSAVGELQRSSSTK